jgi:hypothetical protein
VRIHIEAVCPFLHGRSLNAPMPCSSRKAKGVLQRRLDRSGQVTVRSYAISLQPIEGRIK